MLTTGAAARRLAPVEVPATLVENVHFTGNQAIPSDQLLKRITVTPGKPLKREQLGYSVGIVESTYRDKGYYDVHVSTRIDPREGDRVDLTFNIQEGPLYHVGAVRVEGNRQITESTVRRALNIKSGDLFSQSKFFEGNRQLYMTGFFDSIDVTYATTTAHTVDVTLKVRERATKFVKGSAGYGTETKERLSAGYEDINFLGNARRLDTSITFSGFLTNPAHYRTTVVQTGLTQPYIFGTQFEAQTNISRQWKDREAYDSRETEWRTSLGRRFGRAITASGRYRYQATRVSRVSPNAETPGFTNISAFGPTFTYDNTNDPFLPSLGWRVIGTYEEGVRFFAGDVRFHKLESRAGRFDTFGGWTLFEGVQSGFIKPDSSSQQDVIPIFERYFLGGANTVRGYSEKELGPRDPQGTPLGGNAFLVGNLELRHRIYKKIFGVTFLDAGQLYETTPGKVWPHIRLTSLDDFRYATGLGLRLHSPIGAIRLEVGYKLNPDGGYKFLDRTALHFSIGEVF